MTIIESMLFYFFFCGIFLEFKDGLICNKI